MDTIRVCLIGCGNIGTVLAKHIDNDKNFSLSCVLDSDDDNMKKLVELLQNKPRMIKTTTEIEDVGLVIEAASQDFVRDSALSLLEKADIMIMSVGAFSDKELFDQIKAKAEKHDRKVYIPSGAIPGLDGIKAAAMGKLKKVTLITRKLPERFAGSPGAARFYIGMNAIRKPMVIYEGDAKEAASLFPRNINVSISLALAGLGVEKTRVKVIADPFAKTNVHEIVAEGDFGTMTLRTENLPSPGNKRTSYLAALSAIATLKKISENVQIGT